MGHIIMVASAFAASLSEDAGERSGLALSKEQLVEHLREDHPFRIMLTGDERIQRVGSEEYADTVGDLLYALGAADEPGMPTLGQRLISNLGPDWRALVDIEGVLQVEAVANHHLRRRSETGTLDRTALDADIEQAVGVHRAAI